MNLQGKKSRKAIVFLFCIHQEYLAIGMEIVILSAAGRLHSLSSVAWYTNLFFIPWMPTLTQIHIWSYNCKYQAERKQKSSQKCTPWQQLNMTKEERDKENLTANIRLIHFINRAFMGIFLQLKQVNVETYFEIQQQQNPQIFTGSNIQHFSPFSPRWISTTIPQAANWFCCKLLQIQGTPWGNN